MHYYLGTELHNADFEQKNNTSVLRGVFEALDGLELTAAQSAILENVTAGKTLKDAVIPTNGTWGTPDICPDEVCFGELCIDPVFDVFFVGGPAIIEWQRSLQQDGDSENYILYKYSEILFKFSESGSVWAIGKKRHMDAYILRLSSKENTE